MGIGGGRVLANCLREISKESQLVYENYWLAGNYVRLGRFQAD
jgi:hypothetical protein